MKHKALFLSALVFPGLGNLVRGKDKIAKLRGLVWIFLTVALLGKIFLIILSTVLSQLPAVDPSVEDMQAVMSQSLALEQKLYPLVMARSRAWLIGLVAVWCLSIFDAWRIDRSKI